MKAQQPETVIRTAIPGDARELLEIYRPYVEATAVTFECETPSPKEFRERIRRTLSKYPCLVAEEEGKILGYAYTGPFVGREAYAWSAETTIYLRQGYLQRGLGRRLYEELERISKLQNIHNLYACIAYPEEEDAYLDRNSARFHGHLGYVKVGEFHRCACKFGTWYNMIWMEKRLREHEAHPSSFIPFPELSEKETEGRTGLKEKEK